MCTAVFILMFDNIPTQFNHHVENVRPVNNSQWEVDVLNLQQQSKETLTFDALVVCVG